MVRCGLVVIGLLLITSPAFGFGAVGHHAVCEIAYRELTPELRGKVDAILRAISLRSSPSGSGTRAPLRLTASSGDRFHACQKNIRSAKIPEHFTNYRIVSPWIYSYV